MRAPLLALALVLALPYGRGPEPLSAQGPAAAIPAPEAFFGFPMGAEGQLAGWDRIVEYFEAVGRESDRVVVQELGRSTMGKPYIMAIVSEPETLRNLETYRRMQRAMADPRRTSEAEAARIAREGKVVLLIGTNVHGTEIGGSQMVNDLLFRLATEASPWVDRVLRNVILLLVPSQNPDGQQMVVDWHELNRGTPFEHSPLPDLYHHYVGHDNNRDAYMLTQVETQMLARVTYKEWLPEVYLDKHQMGSSRARIFVPPFKNPPNPNVDPLVWSQVNLLGQAMAARLHEAGKPGVIWGEQYTGYWQGANSTNPWWHNMLALLTEVASARLASPIVQQTAGAAGGPRPGAADAALPPPTDVQYRMNYLEPWLGGTWTLADVVEYQYLSTIGLLEAVASNRETIKRNFYVMNRRAIELYSRGEPYAYVVPSEQRDPIAVARLLSLIQAGAGEVHRARAPFSADDRRYPAGTYVLRLAQPFGRWIKDLLEPQAYPDIRWPSTSGPIDRPYDVTAWSLGMLMGVETIRVNRPFEADLEIAPEPVAPPAGRVQGRGPVYLLDPAMNASTTAVNRLLRAGAEVSWSRLPVQAGSRMWAPGTIVVTRARHDDMTRLARDLSLPVHSLPAVPPDLILLKPPRIAVFDPWGGSIDAGWTRWLLEQHEFPFAHARPPDLRQPDLRARFDVIVLADMPAALIVRGLTGQHIRPEFRGGIGTAVTGLREFVRQGGTIITLGNAAQFAVEHLGVPLENTLQGVDQDRFFCPGSLLRIALDTTHPVAYGMPAEADAMFLHNGAYVPLPGHAPSTSVIARYPESPLLRSGWIIGEDRLRGQPAVLEARIGRGRVIVHGFRVQSRGQAWGTFKLLFNSLFYGPAFEGRALPPGTDLE